MSAIRALTGLGDVLAHTGASDQVLGLGQAVLLMHEHPAWAIWLPTHGSGWTATRPVGVRPPGPDLPMLWVHAETAAELTRMIQSADGQIENR